MNTTDIVPTLGVVVLRNNRVLLVQKKNHPDSAWQLPGGKIELGETLIQAAMRELYETTNLHTNEADFRTLEPVWYATITKKYGTRRFSFRCLVCASHAGEAVETKAAVPQWVDISEVGTLKLVPNTQAAILAAQKP